MHLYVLIGFTFAVTASIIAYGKGRNSLGWFICGLLIGPFSLVVAALSPVVRSGAFVRCSSCGEVIPASASICRYCRSTLKRSDTAPSRDRETEHAF